MLTKDTFYKFSFITSDKNINQLIKLNSKDFLLIQEGENNFAIYLKPTKELTGDKFEYFNELTNIPTKDICLKFEEIDFANIQYNYYYESGVASITPTTNAKLFEDKYEITNYEDSFLIERNLNSTKALEKIKEYPNTFLDVSVEPLLFLNLPIEIQKTLRRDGINNQNIYQYEDLTENFSFTTQDKVYFLLTSLSTNDDFKQNPKYTLYNKIVKNKIVELIGKDSVIIEESNLSKEEEILITLSLFQSILNSFKNINQSQKQEKLFLLKDMFYKQIISHEREEVDKIIETNFNEEQIKDLKKIYINPIPPSRQPLL
ncbi:MAG: hypothetical protein ACRC4M_01100 [Mycoplasma sp.]